MIKCTFKNKNIVTEFEHSAATVNQCIQELSKSNPELLNSDSVEMLDMSSERGKSEVSEQIPAVT